MVAGPLDKIKVVAIIQARMNSSRLPGKVLLPIPLPNGKPVVQWIIDELNNSSFNIKVVIATSYNPENSILYNYCISHSINCYRGDEDDVLSRFIEIVKNEKVDVVIRLTADNPLLDIKLLDKTIHYHLLQRNDYTSSVGLPLGMNFEIISPLALLSLQRVTTTKEEKEHVTPYIKKSNDYVKGKFKPYESNHLKDIRLTIDYSSDYLVVSQILVLSDFFSLHGIAIVEKILLEYPWIFDCNSKNIQKSINII